MAKNLPVLILKNVVFFPLTEARLEFDSIIDKQLLTLADNHYDGQILLINSIDPLETDIEVTDLPNIGILSTIKTKIDMPNGKTRISIILQRRVKVARYRHIEDLFEADIVLPEDIILKRTEEQAYIRSLKRTFDNYVDLNPYISNSMATSIDSSINLDQLTDLIASNLQIDYSKKLSYLTELNPVVRAKMLLDDMNQDLKIIELEKKIDDELASDLDKNQRDFILREKIRLMREEIGDIHDKDSEISLLKKQIDELDCPDKIKKRLYLELDRYEYNNSSSPEIGNIRNYIDWMISLPWGKYTKDVFNLTKVSEDLNKSHFGLDIVKNRILEYLAVKQNTKELKSPIICLVGPPGVGKTSLAKSIATAIGRKYIKISVGGINDEASIVGHRRTYIGSSPGLIISGMKKAGVMNPVFIIDEIDKMTKNIKGDPASSLLEVLDPEQNNAFVDHYIEEEFDLSKVMFITTANYVEQIPIELRDRLEVIELSSYTEYEKLDIAQNYLIPREIKEHGLKEKQVKFSDSAVLEIIRNYTKEAGVRDLERNIASILRKIVKIIVTTLSDDEFAIDNINIDKYLGKRKYLDSVNDILGIVGVVNGLAYTPYGGDTLPIEATFYPGKGELTLTGSLGEVMRESAILALSYIKANHKEFKISYSLIETSDIHIHVPEGAIPKDGPSAGVALTTTLISLFTDTRIHTNVAMTGELTLRGKILPIGGVREKVIGANRNGIKKIFIPRQNEKDLEDIPNEIKDGMQFILVDRYMDIYKQLFKIKRRSEENAISRERIRLPID